MKTLQIGLIGAGRIGKIHAESIALRVPNAKLAAIADIDLPAAKNLAEQVGAPITMEDYWAILEDPHVDAVAICSSTDTHSQIIQDAASAGKHIFCEKPIDHDLGKIDKALAAVEKAQVKFMVGFNRRFDANFRKVRETVSSGEIGEAHILRITSRDPAPPPIEYIKVSGGIFLDMTIHDFDMARYLMASEVEEVYVVGAVRVDPAIGEAGDIDTVVVTLRFANGAIGTIDNSRQAVYGYDQRVEVFGSKGMIAIRNNTADTHVLSNADGIHSELPLYFFLERYMDAYITEMGDFVDCVLNDKLSPVGGNDGRAPVMIGLAAWKSYRENRPVKVSELEFEV